MQYRKGDIVKSYSRMYVAQRDFISNYAPGSIVPSAIVGMEDWRPLTKGRRTLLNQQIAPCLSEPLGVGSNRVQPRLFWPTQHTVRRNA
jgi:hypothetical protein